jgi:hypothetical protein
MTSDLIDHARAVLGGRTPVPPGQQAYLAAVLGRQALEDIIDHLCEQRFEPLGHPVVMRSRLIILAMVLDQDTARAMEIAWTGLSAACHHHAYELTPTTTEIRHLIDIVADLPN